MSINIIHFIVKYLGSKYTLRIEQWRKNGLGEEIKDGAWRVGLNWFDANDYEFICEKPTLLEALQCAYGYATGDKI